MHIIEDERLQNQEGLVERLIIREKIEGEPFTASFEKSGIITQDGDQNVVVNVDHEDADQLEDFFADGAKHLLDRYQLDAIEVECVSVKNKNKYHIPANVIVLEWMRGQKKESDETYSIAPDSMPAAASALGTLGVPQFNMPTALMMALKNGNKGTANKLCKRVRRFPSLYGVADFQPEYYACLGHFLTDDERGMKWDI